MDTSVRRCVAALTVTVLIGALCGVSWARGRARLIINSPVHDFGSVDQGSFVRHIFRFRNAGDADLRIKDVRAPCGCIAAVESEASVAPGGEGIIGVSFDTGRFQGRKTKTVFVSTNDLAQPVRELTITGTVIPKIVADPPVLYLGRIRPGNSLTRELRVMTTSGESIGVVGATVGNPAFEVAVEELSDLGTAGRRIVVRVPPSMISGRFNDRLRIRATNPEPVELDVPIFGSVEGDLLVRPPQATFDSPARGRAGARAISVLNSGSEPVSISGIRILDFPLDYAVKTVRNGYEYRILLQLKQPTLGLNRRGVLHIYTTHPNEPELVVPLYAMMQHGADARR